MKYLAYLYKRIVMRPTYVKWAGNAFYASELWHEQTIYGPVSFYKQLSLRDQFVQTARKIKKESYDQVFNRVYNLDN